VGVGMGHGAVMVAGWSGPGREPEASERRLAALLGRTDARSTAVGGVRGDELQGERRECTVGK
jgi:hypothetical protein